MRCFYLLALIGLFMTACSTSQQKSNSGDYDVVLVKDDAGQKVDVLINGELFTSYIYSDSITVLKKPVLYPVVAPNGVSVTRGYPLNPRPGERTDHPHHIGMWLNYGDVNGLDFWNNSDAIPEKRRGEMGTIRNEKITELKNGKGEAELSVVANWLRPDGSPLLKEHTIFHFIAKDSVRIIDRTTTLTALNEKVVFKDNKEGMFGMRLARQLEHSSNRPVTLSDAHGKKTDVPVMTNEGVTGHYINSEGVEGTDVWGKRAKWVVLNGTIESKDVSIVIMDNPANPGYPAYWHARGYGLFAVNPLGQRIFSKGKEVLNFTLKANESVTFRYRTEVFEGKSTKSKIEKEYSKYL